MRHPVLRFLCLLLGLLVAAWLPLAVGDPQLPRGDEATAFAAASSLWHDHDLTWGARDLARGYAAWPSGPRGLALGPAVAGETTGDEPGIAVGPAWALLAAPFVGLGGRPGGLVLQAFLLATLVAVIRRLRPDLDRRLVLAGVLVSAAASLLWRVEPGLLYALALILPLFATAVAHGSPPRAVATGTATQVAGALGLVVLAVDVPVLAVLALAPVVVVGPPRRRILWLALPALVVGMGWLALGTGVRPGGEGVRRVFGPFPGERGGGIELSLPAEVIFPRAGGATAAASVPGVAGALAPADLAAGGADAASPDSGFAVLRRAVDRPRWSGGLLQLVSGHGPSVPWRLHVRNLRDLLIGRESGLLVHFPVLWLLLAGGVGRAGMAGMARSGGMGGIVGIGGSPQRGRRAGRVLLLLAGLLLVVVVLAFPYAWQGGPDAPANRWAVVLLPAALILLPKAPRPSRLAVAGLIAGLWTAPALVDAACGASSSAAPGGVFENPVARLLPRELALLAASDGQHFLRIDAAPGGAQVLVASRRATFGEEAAPAGLWLRPDRSTELYLITGGLAGAAPPAERTRLAVWVSAVAEDGWVELATGDESTLVRFDTPGKRRGAVVVLPAAPVASDLGVVFPVGERIYRIRVDVGAGAVPARRERSGDDRLLGVFLSPFGA